MAGSTGAAAVYGRTEMMRELNADLCAAGCVLAFKLMVLLQLQALPAQETVPFCRDSAMPTRDTGCHSSQASGRHRDVLQDHRRVVGHVKRGAPSWLLCLHSEMMPGCFWTLDSCPGAMTFAEACSKSQPEALASILGLPFRVYSRFATFAMSK